MPFAGALFVAADAPTPVVCPFDVELSPAADVSPVALPLFAAALTALSPSSDEPLAVAIPAVEVAFGEPDVSICVWSVSASEMVVSRCVCV